jgi:hypothetical protein
MARGADEALCPHDLLSSSDQRAPARIRYSRKTRRQREGEGSIDPQASEIQYIYDQISFPRRLRPSYSALWHHRFFLHRNGPSICVTGSLCHLQVSKQGELFHRVPKSWFERTDRREYVSQISQIERRRARLDQIRHANTPSGKPGGSSASHPASAPPEKEVDNKSSPGSKGSPNDRDSPDSNDSSGRKASPDSTASLDNKGSQPGTSALVDETNDDSPEYKYTIASNQNSPIDISSFAQTSEVPYRDPYLVVCIGLLVASHS